MAVMETHSAPAWQEDSNTRFPVLPDAGVQLHIHVCEASRVQRAILVRMLEEAGFRVTADGHAAESLNAITLDPPDIFLTAIELPDISGLEACWRLKTRPETEHIHTLVLSASGQEARAAESLDAGADDFLRKPIDPNELKARLRAASRIVRLQQRLRGEAETDSLTGAANRRAFMRALQREHTRAQDSALDFSAVMIDLDFFKKINDTHGHASGDRVLKQTVATLKAELRPPALLGRLGGEEFALILPGQDEAAACATAETLRQALETMYVENDEGAPIPVTASIGVAALRVGDIETDGEGLLSRADAALYEAKQRGRNRVCTG